jgi:GNAT superfamily N-acetyltransferase
MEIKIRKTKKDDFAKILEVEKKSYHPLLQATSQVLEYRMDVFGIWVAEVDDKIVGFFTCIPAKLSWPNPEIKKILKNRHPRYKPWFEEYKKNGEFNTLWVTSTAVMSEYQKKGIGTAMVKYSLKLAKSLGLKYRASALRCQYAQFYKKTKKPIQDYIKEVEKGNIKDRFLGLYLKLGFKLGDPLPNYEPYQGSLNYNIFAYKKV